MYKRIVVLLVSKDTSFRRTLLCSLQTEGYTIIEAASTKTALTKTASKLPHIVILDITAIDSNPPELIQKIKTISPNSTCLGLYENVAAETIIDASNAGSSGFFKKSLATDQLIDTLQKISIKINKETSLNKSEEKQTEETILKLSNVVEQASDVIFITDVDGIFEYTNPAFEKITGYSKQDTLGKSPNILSSGKMSKEFYQLFWKTILAGQATNEIIINKKKNGDLFYYDQTITPLVNDHGSIINFLSTGKDITERIQAEALLRKSESRLNDAELLAHLGHWELDLITNTLHWSDEAYNIFGLEPQKISATYETFLDIIHPDDRDFVNEAYLHSVKTRTIYDIVHRLQLQDGTIKYVNEKCETKYAKDGTPIRSLGTIQDITNQVKVEKELLKHREHLEELVEEGTQHLQIKIEENISAQSKIEQQNKELAALNAISAIATETNQIDQILKVALQQITKLLNVRSGESFLLNTKNQLEIATTWKMNKTFKKGSHHSRFPRGKGIPKIAQEKRTILSIGDLQDDPHYLRKDVARKAGYKSAICIPLLGKDSVTGALILYSRTSQKFTQIEKNLLMVIGRHLALAIERSQSQEALRNSEEMINSFMKASTDVIILCDSKLNYIYLNDAAMITIPAGINKNNLIGKNIKEINPGIEKTERYQQFQNTLKTGAPFNVDFISPHPQYGQISVNMRVFKVGDGVGFISTNVTKLVKAQDALQKSQKLYKDLVETSQDLIWSCDPQGRFTFLNKAWEYTLGYKIKDMIGKPIADFKPEEVIERDMHVFKEIIHGKILSGHETKYITKDNKMVDLVFNAIAIKDPDGNVIGTRGTAYDITDRKQMEEALKELTDNLEKRVQTRTEQLTQTNIELGIAYHATLEGWAHALHMRDHETESHTRRVTEMTLRLAYLYGMSSEDLVHIRRGALLHDIGKIAIPDSILLKTGPLSESEWETMKQHPLYASQLLSNIEYLANAIDIPLFHHEHWDGTGYPYGLKGDEIPIKARLFAVADVWDALSYDRPYRKAWPEEKIIAYMKEQSGQYFDPDIITLFIKQYLPSRNAIPNKVH